MTDMDIMRHPYFNTPRLVVNTRAALFGFATGKFTLTECLFLLARKFKNPDTQRKFMDLQRRGIAKFIGEGGSVNLYGHALYPVTGDAEELFYLIDQIVHQNQYRTELIKDGDVVIDAGANKGIFSIKVAHEFPHAKVYAFEPIHETVVILKKNAAPYPNIFCFELGLGDVKASKPMMVDPAGPDGNRMADAIIDMPEDPGRNETRNVPVMTIDDFVAERSVPHIDFIKMGVEGYEGKILLGAAKTIRRYKPTIVMSAYHSKHDVQELPRILESIQPGYRVKLEKRNELDFVCQYPKR